MADQPPVRSFAFFCMIGCNITSVWRLPFIVPPKPEAGEDIEQTLTRVTERVFDLLFSSGIGGFFIPDDKQKWVVREMRMAAQKTTGLDVSQL